MNEFGELDYYSVGSISPKQRQHGNSVSKTLLIMRCILKDNENINTSIVNIRYLLK